MVRLLAGLNMLRARFGVGKELAQAAERVDVVEPASREPAPPLLVLPGMLDRVTGGVPGFDSAAVELGLANATEFEHAPVIRYVLRDCVVHGSGIEYQGGYASKSARIRGRITTSPVMTQERATYCMTRVSHDYFGHWLSDACATAVLAPDPSEAILDARSDWPDTEAYARAFGLAPRSPGVLRVGQLEVYQDFSQGASKRTRYCELRSRLANFAGPPAERRRPVYLRRGTTGKARQIAAEDDLCATLEARGFDIVDLATTGFVERFRRLAAATVVVSVEGSQVKHAMFAMPENAAIISLTPADRFNMVQRGVTHAMGLRYGCVVLRASEAGYLADPDEVLRTVELADAAPRRHHPLPRSPGGEIPSG